MRIPHTTTTTADTSVATINTLSKEATLIVTLRFPSPAFGLVDSLISLQPAGRVAEPFMALLWFAGHRCCVCVPEVPARAAFGRNDLPFCIRFHFVRKERIGIAQIGREQILTAGFCRAAFLCKAPRHQRFMVP
jgi:hypothetical protein